MVYGLVGKAALPIFNQVNRSVSATERAALESGTTGFEGSIFAGKPDWKFLLGVPAPSLTAEEQSFLDNEVEEICRLTDDWKVRDELHDLPPEVWAYLKEKKFFGMIIPKEYGGLGFSAQAHSAVVSKLASRSSTLAATAMVPNSLGPAELLMTYGTQEQKDRYLERLATGKELPCFALTSPKAGSDATGLIDDGVVFRKEDGSLGIRLNWEKRYITLAPVATLFGVAFKLRDPEHLLGDKEELGITLALVPAETKGIERGQRHRPMGMALMNGPNAGTDVEVSLDSAVIGGRAGVGRGWNMLVECLSIGRSISLPASSSGASHLATRVAGAYAGSRQQFNMPLSKMEGVQESLGRMGGLTYLIDAAKMLPLQELDEAHHKGTVARPAVESAILKYYTTEAGRQIAIDAMDVTAGKGVCDGPTNLIGGIYQSVPVGITVEGANILTRNLMIFGQSVFLAHPYTLQELKAAENKDVKAAGKLFLKHTFNVVSNAVRTGFLNLTNGYLSHAPKDGPDKRYYQHINRMASAFAFTANSSMAILQSGLKRYQRTSALLADGFAHTYLAAQVLRRWNYEGRKEEDVPLMKWATEYCLNKAETALAEALDNHPPLKVPFMKAGIPAAQLFVKPLVFLTGHHHKKPSHTLGNQVADIVTTPGATRDRLTAGMYIPKEETEYLAKLEKALELGTKAFPYEQTLLRAAKKKQLTPSDKPGDLIDEAAAKGMISGDVAELMREANAVRNDVIAVDAFPFEWEGGAVRRPVHPQLG